MTDFGRRPSVAAANVLPKTGQETEYYAGDDGTYQAGWEGERFTDNGDGTITDNATNLMWPKDWANFSTEGSKKTWPNMIDHFEGLTLLGHSDWRMPNAVELLSLLDTTKRTTDAFPVFINTAAVVYTTSTTASDDTNYAQGFSLYDLYIAGRSKVSTIYSVPVRNA